MNTGDKNTKGRVIFKGPKGGLYVVGPSGAKIRTFTKAPAAAPAPPRVVAPTNANTFMYKGMKFNRMVNATAYGDPVYKKAGVSTYYTIPRTGLRAPSLILLGTTINKANGTKISLRNYKKAKAAPAPAPAPAPAGPSTANRLNMFFSRAPTPALTAAIAHTNKLKTAAGRVRYVASMRSKLSAANFAALEKHAATLVVTAPAAAAASSVRLTTAERNARLAAIRARLNAMRAAKLAAMPKRRANVQKRLKNAVARVRARLRGNNPTTSSMTIPFCHAPASVPRKACTLRKATISVYNSPMVTDGTMVATRASDIDLDWFKRQDAYVKNLSDYDFWTVQAHTNRSHSWIGPFLYRGTVPSYLPGTDGKHILPLWPQIRKMILDGTVKRRSGSDGWRDAWFEDFKRMSEKSRYDMYRANMSNLSAVVMKRALEMYRDDLKRIISGAPKSRKKMILYRGASFDIFRSTKGHWHNLESFCSAAYDLRHALAYEGGTMQRITVLPGTPVMLVAGLNQWDKNGEYEIMVNFGTKYLIRSRAVKRVLWTGYRRMTRVTDVTIAK
jgi:hypothetical protein